MRPIQGSDLDALDPKPEFKIEPSKGFEDQFEQVVLSLCLSATDVVVTANGYGLDGHQHLDLRKSIRVQDRSFDSSSMAAARTSCRSLAYSS